MTALATVEELAARLPFVMDEGELREAAGALEDLSDDARHYGSVKWASVNSTPQMVKNIILRAAARHMKNPEGYTVSRAGDESVSWGEKGENAGSAHFTDSEIRRLQELGGYRTGFVTVGTYAWGRNTAPREVSLGRVPDEGSNEPITFFSDAEPW